MFNFIQKLQYYPDKTRAFIEGDYTRTLATVLLYMSSGHCNNDCVYCDKNFYEITSRTFDRPFLDRLIDDMVDMGADSLIILGEGAEPLLSPELCHSIDYAVGHGIACGIYTNGSIVSEKIINSFNKLDFMRISLDAGSPGTHRKIHQYGESCKYFDNALELLRRIDKKRVNTGVSFIVMEENADELYRTWEMLSELGVGYLELKIPLAKGYVFKEVDSRIEQCLKEQLRAIEQSGKSGTKVILNNHLEMFLKSSNPDARSLTVQGLVPCYTCSFRTIVSPLGYFLCSPLKNTEEARFGDPYSQSLAEAWNSERHIQKIGRECTVRCTYYRQNQSLIDLKQGKKVSEAKPSTKPSTIVQTHFL